MISLRVKRAVSDNVVNNETNKRIEELKLLIISASKELFILEEKVRTHQFECTKEEQALSGAISISNKKNELEVIGNFFPQTIIFNLVKSPILCLLPFQIPL